MGRARREANRPLSKRQQRAMQGLIRDVEAVRFEVINYTGGMLERKEQDNAIRTEGV